jgi:hypothetical protein
MVALGMKNVPLMMPPFVFPPICSARPDRKANAKSPKSHSRGKNGQNDCVAKK